MMTPRPLLRNVPDITGSTEFHPGVRNHNLGRPARKTAVVLSIQFNF